MKPTNQLINEGNSIILAKDKEIENYRDNLINVVDEYHNLKQEYGIDLFRLDEEIKNLKILATDLTKENESLKSMFPISESIADNSLQNAGNIIKDLETELREEKDLNKLLKKENDHVEMIYKEAILSRNELHNKVFELRRINLITLITIVMYIFYKLIF